MLANVIIVAVVAAFVVVGVKRIVGTATGKRDCCSGDAKEAGRSFRPRECASPFLTRVGVVLFRGRLNTGVLT